MYLKLKNFKAWESAEFEIVENSVSLISGNSGCGKTSILQAIYFALYGKGTKIVRTGSSSCRVELTINGMHIVRTKKPNRLVLDSKYEDAVAQTMIDKIFGKHFNIVAYIEQDTFQSVAYMTPGARLEFLENFAFENVDVEKAKASLKSLTRKHEDHKLQTQTKLQSAENILEKTTLPISVSIPSGPETDVLNIENSIRKKNVDKDKLNSEYTDSLVKVSARENIQQQLQNTLANKSKLEVSLAELKYVGHTEYADLKKKYDAYNTHTQFQEAREKYTEYVAEYNEIKAQETHTREEQLSDLMSQLWIGTKKDTIKDEISVARNQETENKKYREKESRLKYLQPLVDEYLRVLPSSGTPSSCPSCACSLAIVGTKLFKTDMCSLEAVKREKELRDNYAEFIRWNEQTYTYREVDLASLESYYNSNTRTESKISELENSGLSQSLQTLKKKCIAQKKLVESFGECESIDKSVVEIFHEQQSKYKVFTHLEKQILDLGSESKNIEKVLAQPLSDPQELKARITGLNEEITGLQHQLDSGRLINSEWNVYNKYVRDLAEHNNMKSQVAELKNQFTNAETKVSQSIMLKEIILEAESECLENIISTINIHAQQFLESFFPQHPISAQLVPYKQTKTGSTITVKPQIELIIQYKGAEADFDSLSGGERARVSLAFTLALSEIYQTPILMLDESISSLDYDSTVEVLGAIKENMPNRTVLCVSHQANTGLFDNVIEC